jgi:serine/threonine protein kinase
MIRGNEPGTKPVINIKSDLASRYVLGGYISAGSHGHIYKAYDKKANITVCVKVISKTIGGKPSLDSVMNETKIMQLFSEVCDPHIICFIDLYEDADKYYLITELLDRYFNLDEIHKLIYDNGKFDHKLFNTIVDNLIKGLHQIHSAGIVHRDIKPANIMVSPDGKVKYIDFDLSCSREECGIHAYGTPLYTSPEVLFRDKSYRQFHFNEPPHDFESWIQTDYWSLSLVIFELANYDNKHPYELLAGAADLSMYVYKLLPMVLKNGFPFDVLRKNLPPELLADDKFTKLIVNMSKVREQRN